MPQQHSEQQPARICMHCHKALVSIGHERKNGKAHNDWNSRTLHKKCWKEKQTEMQWKLQLESYLRKEELTERRQGV